MAVAMWPDGLRPLKSSEDVETSAAKGYMNAPTPRRQSHSSIGQMRSVGRPAHYQINKLS